MPRERSWFARGRPAGESDASRRLLLAAWLLLVLVVAIATGFALLSPKPDRHYVTALPAEEGGSPAAAGEPSSLAGGVGDKEADGDLGAHLAIPQPAPLVPAVAAAVPQPAIAPARAAVIQSGWRSYAKAFEDATGRARVAVVVTGLGLSEKQTNSAIRQLSPSVTLSFSPYAAHLEQWITLARANGHEVMIDLPMEPVTYPADDPGSQALMTGLPARDNLARLDWTLARGSAYIGVAAYMGSRFTASGSAMKPVLEELARRRLLFLDNRSGEASVVPALAHSVGLEALVNDRGVDDHQAGSAAIDARLAQVERLALTRGRANAMARPFPVSIERLAAWTRDLEGRGLVLAPLSALAGGREEPSSRQ